ncbi:hypothetical protein [Halorubrum sp. Atlit-26R]|uniref:hypothetical protein n=1 Tax=Halorubrum sp. Atlit-26R TaxID=2282128 RepID=UPI000EF18CDA|nr:hypothetical protein [Halorubrum sp. Atlit-26R]RLM62514.1 hypothetical protein DVK07_18800 [Halorubrum sp. Atlit-26R]
MGNTERETVKISMTLTKKSQKWIDENYPEAQSTQEAIRMAINDAREYQEVVESARISLSD